MAHLTNEELVRLQLVAGVKPRSRGGLESTTVEAPEVPEDRGLNLPLTERVALSETFLRGYLEREYPGDERRREILDRALSDAHEAAAVIDEQRYEARAPFSRLRAGLEAVVHTDGTRPSFLIQRDEILFHSSPPGVWAAKMNDAAMVLTSAFGGVGRIDMVHERKEFAGTGWLVTDDLLVTNRHVAEEIVNFDTDGPPQLIETRDAHVNFGHEYQGYMNRNRRRIEALVFCGPRPIGGDAIDHEKLDLAVFRLAPGDSADPQTLFAIGIGDHLAQPQTDVLVLGYPAAPPDGVLGADTDSIMKLLFAKLWGKKRIAPGWTLPSHLGERTLSHDTSTLGGSSGSAIIGLDSVPLVLGLHYGGRWGEPRINWAHRLETVLDEPGLPNLGKSRTLRELARDEDIKIKIHDPLAPLQL